jgi:hypothetical protein
MHCDVFYQNFIAVGLSQQSMKKINFSKELLAVCRQQEERWFRNKKMCRPDYPGVFQTFRSPTERFSLIIIRTRACDCEELPGDWLLLVVVAGWLPGVVGNETCSQHFACTQEVEFCKVGIMEYLMARNVGFCADDRRGV